VGGAFPGPVAFSGQLVERSGELIDISDWPSDRLIRGAYTCNQPGYVTGILGKEAPPTVIRSPGPRAAAAIAGG
jgi:hypothetical protein